MTYDKCEKSAPPDCSFEFDDPGCEPGSYLDELDDLAMDDLAGLRKAEESYGDSWKRRGGVGAFMMLARKWDRLEKAMSKQDEDGSDCVARQDRYDIFDRTLVDNRSEGIIDDIRDLRRYLMLVEAELRVRGLDLTHRDNG